MGILNVEILAQTVKTASELIREYRIDPDSVNREDTVESTGDFIWNLCFMLFYSCVTGFILLSPELRWRSPFITILAVVFLVVLLSQLPGHFRRVKKYRESN